MVAQEAGSLAGQLGSVFQKLLLQPFIDFYIPDSVHQIPLLLQILKSGS